MPRATALTLNYGDEESKRTGRDRAVAPGVALPRRALLRSQRPGDQRLRVRPVDEAAGRARSRAPGAGHARFADAARIGPTRRELQRSPPPLADAVARQHLLGRG